MLGCAIMILTNIFVGIRFEKQLVSVSFTALVLNELIMIALEINTWHKYMIYSELATFLFYFISFPFLGDYFGMTLRWRGLISRSVIHNNIGILVKDCCYSCSEFGTDLGVKGVEMED